MIAGLGALAGCNGGSNGTIIIRRTPTAVPTFTPAPTASAISTSTPSTTQTPTPTPSPTTVASLSSLSGTLQGGLSPVSGAAVSLYAAGTAYGSNATFLASNTSDSNGKFTVGYSPPGTPTVLYLVALGGVAGPATNTAIGLIGVAGMSNTLPASVTINELTTVAAEWALAQFIDSTGQVIGAPLSNTTGFTNAVSQAQANLADIATGAPASFLPWSSSSASCTAAQNCDGLERLDTLANILAACVESAGASSIACDLLLSLTGSGNNTLQAAHVIATNPTANVGTLFALQSRFSAVHPLSFGTSPDGLGDGAQLWCGRRLQRTNGRGNRRRRERLGKQLVWQHCEPVDPQRRPGRHLRPQRRQFFRPRLAWQSMPLATPGCRISRASV